MHIVFGEPGFRPGFPPGFRRITFARPGLFAIIMGALALGAVAAALILLLLGTLFVALPVIGALIVIGFVTAVVRGADPRPGAVALGPVSKVAGTAILRPSRRAFRRSSG